MHIEEKDTDSKATKQTRERNVNNNLDLQLGREKNTEKIAESTEPIVSFHLLS